MPWKKAYPTKKVQDLLAALKKHYKATISQDDLNTEIQASANFNDLVDRLVEKCKSAKKTELVKTLKDMGF